MNRNTQPAEPPSVERAYELTAPGSTPRWQRERARKLHRICLSVEARNEKGENLIKLIRQKSSYWKGKVYRTDNLRRVRIAPGHLIRLFYLWRRNGRSPAAFAMNLGANHRKISRAVLKTFLRVAVISAARSFHSTWLQTQPRIGTPSAYHHALPLNQRRALTELFRLRRAALRQAHKIIRLSA